MKKKQIYIILSIVTIIVITLASVIFIDRQKNNFRSNHYSCIKNKIYSLNNPELLEYYNDSDICMETIAKNILSPTRYISESITASTGMSQTNILPKRCDRMINLTNESIKQEYNDIVESCHLEVYDIKACVNERVKMLNDSEVEQIQDTYNNIGNIAFKQVTRDNSIKGINLILYGLGNFLSSTSDILNESDPELNAYQIKEYKKQMDSYSDNARNKFKDIIDNCIKDAFIE